MKAMETPEMDTLERILTDEDELEPMVGFSTRVMRAVREDEAATEPIAFPWARFLPGVVVQCALLLGAALWIVLESSGRPPAPSSAVQWLVGAVGSGDPQAQAVLGVLLAWLGTGVLAWITTRWVTPRRISF